LYYREVVSSTCRWGRR